MNLFIDANLSPSLSAALNGYLEMQRDGTACHARFNNLGISGDTADVEWINILKSDAKKWFVISADLRIKRNPAEVKAWQGSGLVGVLVKPSFTKLLVEVQIAKLFMNLSNIKSPLGAAHPGTFFELNANAKITKL